MRILSVMLLFLLVIAYGCSSGGSNAPILPDTKLAVDAPGKYATGTASHTNWGLWQFVCDPEKETMDVIMLRTGAFHLNALPFVDTPPLTNLTLESLVFTGNGVEVGIGLRHPFLGLAEFTGFDVKGVLISDGSVSGFTDPDINMPGEGDTRLMNPDGLTRWWNPVEFPHGSTIFGYVEGILGTPDSIADYTGILNGYKYFCDDLTDPDSPLSDIDPEGHGIFSAGEKNVRHYSIEFGGDGLVFNYAVDTSWKFPEGGYPWEVPDDFTPDANQPEAYRISITETENTLYYDEIEGAGGDLSLMVDVYDWYGADLHTVYAEWPGFATQAASAGPVGGGVGYSTYQVDLLACTPTSAEDQEIFITVACEEIGYQDFVPDAVISSYFIHTTKISGEVPPSGFQFVFSDEGILQEIYMAGWNDISPALCVETDGEIKMAYNHNMPYDPTPGVNHYARSYACKSTDGLNWYGFQPSFYSSGGYIANHGDSTKIVASTDGNSWRSLHLWNPASPSFLTPFSAATELYPPPIGIDGAHVTTYITRAPEMIQDADGYVYVMGDRDNQLQFKKSLTPGSLTGGTQLWGDIPVNYIGATGYFSRARSIELAPDGFMYFVYYQNDTSNVIRLAHNTDSTGLTWDTSTVVYDGNTTGTSGAHDPGLDITPDGEFHVTFGRKDFGAGTEQLCYVHSADGSSWSEPVVIAEMNGAINDDPICFFQFDGLDWVAAVWQAGTHVYISASWDGGDSWVDATQVDSLVDENIQPDFVVTDDGVMHIAWAALNGTQYDIHYRNAWLEEY